MLKLLDEFLIKTENNTLHCSTLLNLSREDISRKIFSFFMETGVRGTCEASDYTIVGTVSPFLGEIVDLCCRNVIYAPVKELFE